MLVGPMRLRMAWAQVRPRLGQLAAAIVMIGVGVALAGGTLLANQALKASFEESLHALAGTAELQVKAVSGGGFSEDQVEKIRAVPGVTAAAPLLIGTALLPGKPET